MNSYQLSAVTSGTIPYVVGATGHRDLVEHDLPVLRKAVSGIVVGIRRRMPSTPIVVVSSLAEGADQLIADVAMDEGAILAVALPMPPEIYRELMSVAGREGFDRLLARAAVTFQIEQATQLDVLAHDAAARDAQYHILARFIVDYCQALIALWDGLEPSGPGGTGAVVQAVLARSSHVERLEPPRGTVFHVVTRRTRHATEIHGANTVRTLTGAGAG